MHLQYDCQITLISQVLVEVALDLKPFPRTQRRNSGLIVGAMEDTSTAPVIAHNRATYFNHMLNGAFSIKQTGRDSFIYYDKIEDYY